MCDEKKQEQENESESLKVSAKQYRFGKLVLFLCFIISLIALFSGIYIVAYMMTIITFWIGIIVVVMANFRYRQLKLSFGKTHLFSWELDQLLSRDEETVQNEAQLNNTSPESRKTSSQKTTTDTSKSADNACKHASVPVHKEHDGA